MQRDRSMAVDVISEFLHTGGPPLNADDAAIAIVDVLEREGFNLDRVRDARGDDERSKPLSAIGIAEDDDDLYRELPAEPCGECEMTDGHAAWCSLGQGLAARSPQGEDREAAVQTFMAALVSRGWVLTVQNRRDLRAALSRVVPSRDGTAAVDQPEPDALGGLPPSPPKEDQ